MATIDSRYLSRGTRFSILDSVGYQPSSTIETNTPASLVLDFLDDKHVDDWSKVTFTRTSPATYFDKDGLLKSMGYNLLTYSQEFTGWLLSGATFSPTMTTAPDGTITAKNLIYVTGAAFLQSPTLTKAASSIQYTGTFYVKQTQTNAVLTVTIDNGGITNRGTATFNTATMTFSAGTLVSTGTFTADAAYAPVSVGNGWYRLGITVTTDSGTGVRFRRFWTNAVNLEIWGAQLEVGSTASTYSPTTTAASGAPRFDYDPATPAGVTGGELVTNGTFSSGTTGWTASASTLSVVNGRFRVSGNTAFGAGYATIAATVGKRYQITAVVGTSTAGASNLRIRVGTAAQDGSMLDATPSTDESTLTTTFTASTTAPIISLMDRTSDGVSYAEFVSVSVQEVTFTPRGLLVEEARTNLIPTSNSFNNNGGISAATFAQNVVDPAGATTAWTITESATSAPQYGIATNGGSATLTAAVHTASAFVKAGTNTRCQIVVSSSLSTDYANFLLTGSGSVSAATTLANCAIVALGGGWYRVSMVFTSAANTGSVVVSHINSATDTRLPTYLGTSRTLIAYGCQIELGAFPTSYIPTTTSSATRSADSASMTGTNFSSWYSQEQGTFVVDMLHGANDSANRRIINVNDGTSSNSIQLCHNPSGVIFAATYVNPNSDQTLNVAGPLAQGVAVEAALAYESGTKYLTRDGLAVGSNSLYVPSSGMTQIFIGSTAGTSSFMNGHIRKIIYYPVRLPNATLKSMTKTDYEVVPSLVIDFTNNVYMS